MKFSIIQENFYQGLQIVSHLANKNTNLPILSNILINIENKNLKLASTNLEMAISCLIRAKIEQEGEFTVDAKLLADYISLLPNDKVDVLLKNDQFNIECRNNKTKIKGLPAADFPVIPTITKEKPFTCSVGDFRQAIAEVIFAVSTAETRPEISGVFLKFDGTTKQLILTSTDSYRLAERKIKLIKAEDKIESVIVPVKTLQEISRILGLLKNDIELKENADLEIYITENQILFSYNNIDLISRIIEGKYPDYQQIIPQDFKTRVILETADLIKIIKATSLFTKSGIFDVKLEFNTVKKELIISASNSQTGENIANLPAEIEGEDNEIVLNFRYLLDGLQNLNSEKVVININEPSTPVLIKPEKDQEYLYVIMPIKQ